MEALVNSLGLALITATVSVVIGTFLAMQIKHTNRASEKVTDVFSLLPNTVPGIVTVVGLILLWNAPWMSIKIYGGKQALAEIGYFFVQYLHIRLSFELQHSDLRQLLLLLIHHPKRLVDRIADELFRAFDEKDRYMTVLQLLINGVNTRSNNLNDSLLPELHMVLDQLLKG